MSRFSDYDDFEGLPEQILAQGRWERNARAVLKSRRGRNALAELREALLALPEPKLIEGAVCTVGAAGRRDRHVAEATRAWEAAKPSWRTVSPWTDEADKLDALVQRDGEGVCAVGAYAWYRKVKAGMDPAEAFASLPDVAEEGTDALSDTAYLGKEAGMVFTLAWELAYRNDETFGRMTPEERYTAFLEWTDAQLGAEAVSAP
jgi:hypothetical protein